MNRPVLWFLALLLTSCGGVSNPEQEAAERLPHVAAPLDTLQEIRTRSDSGVFASNGAETLRRPSWTGAELEGYPPPAKLSFSRYTNPEFGYSIAYPDSIMSPAEPIGDARGIEFASATTDVRMIVYAVDERSFEDLDDQYQSTVEERDISVTYRARDENFYIVAGRREDTQFYEKALFGDGIVKTFRIEYPTAHKAYFDAVTALIAASFEESSAPADGQ